MTRPHPTGGARGSIPLCGICPKGARIESAQKRGKVEHMALNWNWDKTCGELTITTRDGKPYDLHLYEGNAVLIMLDEFTDKESGKDMWQMYGFFVDLPHMKRCLGITKNFDGERSNVYDCAGVQKLRINKARNRKWKQIVDAFLKAFPNLPVEIYSEE